MASPFLESMRVDMRLRGYDIKNARRVAQEQKRVNVDFPVWMIESLDREASRLGVTRQSIIKMWVAERLDAAAAHSSDTASS